MDLGLRDRVALVAGATRGIGLAVANALAGEGATVAFCGRSRQRAAERAKPHAGAIGVELDLNDEDAARAAVAEVRDRLGPIDILVLNGGGPPAGTALGVDVSRARQAADLLLYGHLRLVSECVATMRERGWGRIVAVGSSAVHQPIDTLATSSMFRAGLGSYLKLLAGEVAADGVTVNMVLPGRSPPTGSPNSTRARRIARDAPSRTCGPSRGRPSPPDATARWRSSPRWWPSCAARQRPT